MKIAYRAKIINPISEHEFQFFDPGYLVVSDGTIDSVTDKIPTDRRIIEFHDEYIIPGMIDTHVHLPQFPFIGNGDEDLLSWLEKYTFPEESKFSNTSYAFLVATNFFDSIIANGTTTASIYTTVHESATCTSFNVAANKGIKALIGKVMMDTHSPDSLIENLEESVAASIRLYEKWNGHDNGRLQYVFSPRFALTCSEELMEAVGDFCQANNAHVQTHHCESPGEMARLEELFPGQSYSQVYEKAGLLGEKTILAHSIHMNETDSSLLEQTGTRIAHCPYANRFLKSGTMPYFQWKEKGIPIGLGTDVAGGPSLSMFRQMGEAILTSYDIQAKGLSKQTMNSVEAFYLATLGGANVLGMEDTTGNFRKGKDADFITITDSNPMSNQYNSPEEVLSRLCFHGSEHSVNQVFVRGNRIK